MPLNKQRDDKDKERRRSRRNRMNSFKINEVSGVDVPAQEGATVAIMKRADAPKPRRETRKDMGGLADLLTSEEEGHQHGINVRVYDGQLSVAVSYASGPDDEGGHYPDFRNSGVANMLTH